MTSASTRIVVFTLIVNLLFRVAAAPFSAQDILDIFGNPFRDIKKSLVHGESQTNYNWSETTTEKIREEDNADTKMIEVPPNTKVCEDGAQRDTNGVCRHPWWSKHYYIRTKSVVRNKRHVNMDAKIVLFLLTMVLCVPRGDCGVVFNFHDKLDKATTTTTESTQTGQVIRVPELECPLGQRRDSLGNCRTRF